MFAGAGSEAVEAPLVSVIIPTRNRALLLARTLTTVLAQRLVPLEVIVVDDASTDVTPVLLRHVGDDRLRTIRRPGRRGVAAARNTGVAAATGRWVAFLDDDDLWAPDKLRYQVDALLAHPGMRWAVDAAVVVDGDLRVIGGQPAPVQSDLSSSLLAANVVPGGASGVVAERELVQGVGGFDTRLSLLADWDLWTRLALCSPAIAVPEPLHAYRVHASSMSARNRNGEDELRIVEAKYACERRERGVALARQAFDFWLADSRQRGGRRLAAADAYVRSVGYTAPLNAALHAAAALVWPGSLRHVSARRAARTDPRWVAEAETWLAPLRTAAVEEPTVRVPAA
jgi:glycosyltransferase involved in cell wall biosynthesis